MAAGFRGDQRADRLHRRQGAAAPRPAAAGRRAVLRPRGRTPAWGWGCSARRIGGLLAPDLDRAPAAQALPAGARARRCPTRSTSWSSAPRPGWRWKARSSGWPTEIRPANRAVAAEFALCCSELRILADRRDGAAQHGRPHPARGRCAGCGTTLAQTLQYGTPLTQALRTLSAEMRHEQLVRFEAKAARLPVLLTVPMITCILPTLFLVVAGPAMLQALRLW